jgi:predicted nucleic acid-binding protein
VEADAAYGRLRQLPVQIVDDQRDLDRAWDLARRYDDHPLYDMVYVAVAERRGAVFITADEGLRRRLRTFAWVVGPDSATGS